MRIARRFLLGGKSVAGISKAPIALADSDASMPFATQESLDFATTRENVRRASALVRMDRVSESIDQYIQVVRKYVADQERKVERQQRMITQLEQEGREEAAGNARTLLAAMENLLSQMRKELAETEHRWAERISKNERYTGGTSGS
jgi:lysyl-tRNA synthetase class I